MTFQPGQSGNPAGRPPKADRFATIIARAEKRCADRLPRDLKNLEALADGGFEIAEDVWEAAGTITLKVPLRSPDGELVLSSGRPTMIDQLVFPDRSPDELVLVRRTVRTAERDRAANIYLADRILGRPAAAIEAVLEHHGRDMTEVIVRYEDAIARIYGSDADT